MARRMPPPGSRPRARSHASGTPRMTLRRVAVVAVRSESQSACRTGPDDLEQLRPGRPDQQRDQGQEQEQQTQHPGHDEDGRTAGARGSLGALGALLGAPRGGCRALNVSDAVGARSHSIVKPAASSTAVPSGESTRSMKA